MILRFRRILSRLSLQTVLTVPLITQIIVTSGLIGYVSLRNSQFTANTLSTQLRQEITARIVQQLQDILTDPHTINQMNAYNLERGNLNLRTGLGTEQLWQQTQFFDSINLIYCATEADGAFLGVGYSNGGVGNQLQVHIANPETERFMYYYALDSTGQRTTFDRRGTRPFDPRQRPWYEAAQRERQQTWSEIYIDFDAYVPVITASTPVFDREKGDLLGVCATDFILSEEITGFLQKLKISPSGLAFILEPSGFLVGSSVPEHLNPVGQAATDLFLATESGHPLIAAITQDLIQQFGGLEYARSSQRKLWHDGDYYYLELFRFQDNSNLDWIIVIAVPEKDFMAQIHDSMIATILFCVIAILGAIIISLLLTQWFTEPLIRLSVSAREIARGAWDQAITLDRADVIGDLSRSFADMAQQLKESFNTLETRIEERTSELAQLNRELDRLAHTDGLTKTANRRYFDKYWAHQWQQQQQKQKPLTLILCDVDCFKQFNDTYGHQAGDECLQQIAEVLLGAVRCPCALVARYGGEEFAVVLPDTDEQGGLELAERIRLQLQEQQIPHTGSPPGYVTVSMGLATLIPSSGYSPDQLLAAADAALYEAKAQGRDRYNTGSVS